MSSLTIPPTRRIVLAHGPLPSASGSIDTEASGSSSSTALEPPVQILHDDDYVEQVWFSSVPADPNPPGETLRTKDGPPKGLVVRGGANCRTATLLPGEVTPMHRTSSLDYNIITHGTVTLLTPSLPSRPSSFPPSSLRTSRPDVLETRCTVGDVVVQRGNLHAWRNDSDGVVRWTCVLVDARAVDGLEDAWVVEGSEEGKGEVRKGIEDA